MMSLRRAICGFALLAGCFLLSHPAQACPGEQPCVFEGGSYHALQPAGWDGESPLPVLVFFHGYRQTGLTVIRNQGIYRPLRNAGVLLIAPNGLGKTWAHVGSPSQARDEMVFLDGLLADIKARWPIDERRLWASGFSQGGSMAWDAACYRGQSFAAFFPAAGAFWRPHPASCPQAPVDIAHAHGTADTVVPMEGRQIREIYRQGDVLEGIALWREENGCLLEPARIEEILSLNCRIWDGCASGKEVRLCLHDRGHVLPEGWLATSIDWANRLAESQAAAASGQE